MFRHAKLWGKWDEREAMLTYAHYCPLNLWIQYSQQAILHHFHISIITFMYPYHWLILLQQPTDLIINEAMLQRYLGQCSATMKAFLTSQSHPLPDGNCLFHLLCKQMTGDHQQKLAELRELLMKFISHKLTHFWKRLEHWQLFPERTPYQGS